MRWLPFLAPMPTKINNDSVFLEIDGRIIALSSAEIALRPLDRPAGASPGALSVRGQRPLNLTSSQE
jgi:hypothetical protein